MLDFLIISTRRKRQSGIIEIYPKFVIKKSADLMIRGGDFYAIWDEERGTWSTDEDDVIRLIDTELKRYYEQYNKTADEHVKVLYLWDAESGMIDAWHKYCQKQTRDNYHMLDEKLIFSNDETNKKDYASRRLNYPLEEGSIAAYDKLMSTLYSPEERHKIEWAIGSIVTGDSKHIQKFMVLYGEAGAGKSTVLNIIQKLFEGYYSVFDARALGSTSNSFALEAFKSNPLVAIQHDGDLSKIEDNTRLNSLVSHEEMTVNEKFKSTYTSRFKCFLFMGTNKPVKITDGKSGLLRRLIDVSPSGKKLSRKEYDAVVKQINFELGAIAWHCRDVYLSDTHYYDSYMPMSMLGASNDFYNFMIDSYHVFLKEDGTTLKAAWEMYRTYCEEANVPYPFSQRNFKEELKNYFWDFNERFATEDGARVRSYYSGFRVDKFDRDTTAPKKEENKLKLIEFECTESIFDKQYADCLAQYATTTEIPTNKWDKVKTKLSDIDTSRIHYVMPPENHIVIDFDIKDKNGNKSFKLNVEAASKWPATYAELSKSGEGIHLHYIYTGDPSKLSGIYDDQIEIKVFTGKSSLRRRLTKCNNLPIATISSGLPLKEEKKMLNFEGVKNEKHLRTMIKKNLNKECHSSTRCSIDFINKILNDAYDAGLKYDVSDLKNAVFAFAANSTNQSSYCIKLVNQMKFKSEEPSEFVNNDEAPIVFYDVEVFPNLFLVNWKMQGKKMPIVRLINPSPTEIEELVKYRLIGFNCRRYDNHMLYGCLIGYDNEQLYNLSQRIISGDKNAFFGEAYNISYTDVYDFAATKQSLKKWEIELGIHHQELGLPWDQPVPEDQWVKVAEYCDNDVIATEEVFDHLKGDWTARQILADVAGLSVNDTTNSLTTRIIFGTNRNPQKQFNYRDMGDMSFVAGQPKGKTKYDPEYTWFDDAGRPIFPGYKYEAGISTYRGEEVGEGGYVYAEPGVYTNIALLDIASMHPASIIAEELFGPEFTKRFQDIRDARVAIKHKDFELARTMLNGALAKYLDDESTAADLAQALKIAINSVYGLTAAKFANPFRDPRNKDNIVAKRGALFMVNLKHEVQKRGFTVVHCKTDSIKIADATPDIIQFVSDYGEMYGYTFEHEATYEKICLVNNAVYIAKYKDGKHAGEWTATGTQFQVPYVFKTLFSKEPITFEDMCETKQVSKGSLYLDMNETLPDVSMYEKELDDRRKGKKRLNPDLTDMTDDDLVEAIKPGHNYIFVGRVGQFCPIKPGCDGGVLYRVDNDKCYAAAGTDGYRWLESELVKNLSRKKDIDKSYYIKLVDDAKDAISQYGDFEQFISDDPVPEVKQPSIPPWSMPCGKDTCEGCEHFSNDQYHFDCRLGYDIGNLLIAQQIDAEMEAFKRR